MKGLCNVAVLLLIILASSCSEDGAKLGKPVPGTQQATSHFDKWWMYYTTHIKFYKKFIAFDTNASVMPVDSFMKKYASGEYTVSKYTVADSIIQYKLDKLPADADENIGNMLRAMAYADYENYLKTGKPLPGFGYKAIDGRVFDTATTKGKLVVMKFWFIGCLTCIEEMPELNRIVALNRDRKDVVFLSIALDEESALQRFLARRRFDYAVVGNKKAYLNDTLNISSYPTHMLIDRHGAVKGIAGNVKDLKEMLAAESLKL